MNYIRFTGEVSIIVNKGKRIARANFICPDTGKRKQIGRNVLGDKVKDEKAAKEKVVEAIEKILNRAPDKKRKTFDDLADYFIEHRAIPAVFVENVKVAGMKSYKSVRDDIKVLRKYFGKMMLEDISREAVVQMRLKELKRPVRRVRVVDGVKESYMKPRALASVHHQIRSLSSMLHTALEIGWLDRLPSFKGLASLAIENKREAIPTLAEVNRLLFEAGNSQQPVLKCFLLLIIDCGARPVETYRLKHADVSLDDGFLILTSDKGRKRTFRKIGITERLAAELSSIPVTNEYVLGGIKSVKNSFNKAKERAGYKYDAYALRHYYISRLDRIEHLSQIAKMRLAGHSNIRTTDGYVKLSESIIADAAQWLSDGDVQELDLTT